MLNETMVKFSIAPIDGGWRWKTTRFDGSASRQGVVASKALAAAMVIRDIVGHADAAPASRAAKAA